MKVKRGEDMRAPPAPPYLTIPESLRVMPVRGVQDLTHLEHIALDSPNTVLHDDAFAITPEAGGYHICLSISSIALHCDARVSLLPERYESRPHGAKRNYSLNNGFHRALTIQYWTDLKSVYDATIGMSCIDVRAFAHRNERALLRTRNPPLPMPLEERLLTAANLIVPGPNTDDLPLFESFMKTQVAIERFSTMFQYLNGNFLGNGGYAAPYRTFTPEGEGVFSAEPISIGSHVPSTSPLRDRIDRVGSRQALKAARGDRDLLSRKRVNDILRVYGLPVGYHNHQRVA